MFDVVGVGTNSVDQILILDTDFEEIAASGKARVVAEPQLQCGGQTATTLSACASWGLRCRYVGAFGSDDYARLVRTELASRGIEVQYAVACPAPNRSAVILVDTCGQRTVLWHRSDKLRVRPDRIRGDVLSAKVVHVDDDDPRLALSACGIAIDAGIPVTSDIEQLSETVEELIARVTYPIFSQGLPAKVTGERDPERALRKLRRLNPNLLCMTLGEGGAVALDGDDFYVAPAFAANLVDSTGAGDVFRAGFIYALLQGWTVPERLRFANAAAAVSCTRRGAIPSVPSLNAALEVYRR